MSSRSGRKRVSNGHEKPVKKLTKMPSAQDFLNNGATNKLTLPAFKPKNKKQALAYKKIDESIITFLKGKVGTGKTRIAINKALEEYIKGNFTKIIFLRASVTAEEEIGFLKGSAEEKIAPYIASMLEPAYELYGALTVESMIEEKIIDYIPIGFLRGRNFKNAFVIVDELQNLTFNQMKLIMTRLLDSSKMVLMGDSEQIDLRDKFMSAIHQIDLFKGVEPAISIVEFGEEDIVRAEITILIDQCLSNGELPIPSTNVDKNKSFNDGRKFQPKIAIQPNIVYSSEDFYGK